MVDLNNTKKDRVPNTRSFLYKLTKINIFLNIQAIIFQLILEVDYIKCSVAEYNYFQHPSSTA